MKEKEFQKEFSTWVRGHSRYIRESLGVNCVFELKICRDKSVRFDAVAEHQEKALAGAMGADIPCYHKINDQPFIKGNPKMRFTNKKPFDCFFISRASAYIGVFFYKKGQRKTEREFILVPYLRWQELKNNAVKKSAREEELKKVGITIRFDEALQ